MAEEQQKIFENEWKKEEEFPELLSYEELLYTPQSLEDINLEEGETLKTISNSFDENGNLIKDLINTKLDTATKQILGDFTFGASGAIKILGSGSAGVWISPTGILGKNTAGQTTFALNAFDGSAVFKGEILAGSIIGGEITGGTLTGTIIQTGTSGANVYLSANEIRFRYGTTPEAYAYTYSWPRGWGLRICTDKTSNTRAEIELSEGTTAGFAGVLIGGDTVLGLSWGYEGISGICGADFVPDGSGYNLGRNVFYNKWQHLYLSGNIYVDGTVDGVDISDHAADINAHHPANCSGYTIYPDGISTTGSCYLGWTYTYDIIPRSNNYYELGSTSYKWYRIYVTKINGVGTINLENHLKPVSAGAQINLGNSTDYFNEIFAKYFTDVGCLGWFEEGVELLDGRTVSDLEALENIKPHPTKKTIHGVSQLDYSTLPKPVYRPAPIAEEDIYDEETKKIKFRKGEKIGEDGAELTALISIMIGAIKELNRKVKNLEVKTK